MKERKESLDCLKGIAIVLVMFGHVQVHNRMTDPYLYDVIKSLQMPLFFLISGYLAGAGTKIRDLAHYRAVMKKRAVSYLLPFFSWLVIQHITYVPRLCHRTFSTGLRTLVSYGALFVYLAVLFGTACGGEREEGMDVLAVVLRRVRTDSSGLSGRMDIFKSVASGRLSALLYPFVFLWAA